MSFNDRDIVIEDLNVRVVYSAGEGDRSVLAARDITAKSQLMLVDHPLLIALDTPHLAVNCYSCFRTPRELPRDVQGQAPSLQRCSGCKVVRFCDKVRDTTGVLGTGKLLMSVADMPEASLVVSSFGMQALRQTVPANSSQQRPSHGPSAETAESRPDSS